MRTLPLNSPYVSLSGNLIQFYVKYVKSHAVFLAAIISQLSIATLHYLTTIEVVSIGFLWYNAIGCILVVVIGILLQSIMPNTSKT